ncbi:Nuclear transport factor 2 (NTF2) domain [Carpediemonas membranifera]|uniref:Nuclear transport factor 2 n=1 Tax=Carpediemonas membranifera TaxID=201153 RepID=A0A8J6C149_9EUKA|nr:Nuclear transport factor 2 (NTF2) domain [Carpediemonas membranifera]|eukprot:KAG9397221.1 Nuclear transport factor 2 (NTF2) domain [Carpediemonas membranifera]
MSDPVQIGTAFVKFYYQTFDTDRANLASLYQANSMLTFSGAQAMGSAAIMEKLTSLSFRKVQHDVEGLNINIQPTVNDSILVFVSGQLIADDDSDHPMMFSQVFTLCPSNGQWFILNDIFNLSFL